MIVRRFIDWRFLVALAFLILVATIVVGGYENARRKDRQIVTKDAQITALINQGERERSAAAQRALEAAQEREELLEAASDLERRLDRLLAYLQASGIRPPPDLDPPPANKNSRRRQAAGEPKPSSANNPQTPGPATRAPGQPGEQTPGETLLPTLEGIAP